MVIGYQRQMRRHCKHCRERIREVYLSSEERNVWVDVARMAKPWFGNMFICKKSPNNEHELADC